MLNGFDSGGHEVTGNTIQGLAPPGQNTRPAQCAFHIEDTKGVKVCYNTVDGTQRGIHVAGNCDGMEFKNNDIYSHQQGLFLSVSEVPPSSGGIVMGVQVRHGNRWLGQYEEAGAKAESSNSPPGIDASQFIVETSVPPSRPTVVIPDQWFETQPGDVNNCEVIETSPGEGTPFEAGIAGGVISAQTPWGWEANRALYLQLLENPTMLEGSTLFQSFFHSQMDSSAAQLARVQHQYRLAMKADTTQEAALIAAKQEKYLLIDSMALLHMLFFPDMEDTVAVPQLETQEPVLLQQLANWEVLERQLKDDIIVMRKTRILPLIALNEQVQTYQPHDLNEKMLTDFLLKASIGLATASDSAIIQSIALQETFEGGVAAKKARGYLAPEIADWALYQSEEEFSEIPNLAAPENPLSINTAHNLLLVPNPAGEVVKVFLPEEAGLTGELRLQSLSGVVLIQRTVTEDTGGMVEMPVNSLPDGVYFCVLRTSDGRVFSSKLIVQK